MHLQELFWRQDGQTGEFQFGAFEISDVSRDQCRCPARNCKLNQVVVAFVHEVRPPRKIDFHPARAVEQGAEHFRPFRCTCLRARKEGSA